MLYKMFAYLSPPCVLNLGSNAVAIKAPNQDLCFLKALKEYEKVDTTSSKASISKFVHHLWYLYEETVMLSLFDKEVDSKTKTKMINNLNKDESSDSAKRYLPSKEEITQNLFEMTLDDFVTQRSKQFLSRLQIDESFLREDVSSWDDNPVFWKLEDKYVV
ncbi:hypothetical protein evm_013442 [Chilo suppressalis]|nr:hypothetical protein evm_013442 [Chilo suppressalis]